MFSSTHTSLRKNRSLDKLRSKYKACSLGSKRWLGFRLAELAGDWHEFESKALRKENEKKEKERRRQAQKNAIVKAEKDKKRGPEEPSAERDAKRVQTSN